MKIVLVEFMYVAAPSPPREQRPRRRINIIKVRVHGIDVISAVSVWRCRTGGGSVINGKSLLVIE